MLSRLSDTMLCAILVLIKDWVILRWQYMKWLSIADTKLGVLQNSINLVAPTISDRCWQDYSIPCLVQYYHCQTLSDFEVAIPGTGL